MRVLPPLIALALTTPAHAAWKSISTEQDLKRAIVGKSFVNPDNGGWFRLRRNGKLTGGVEEKKLSGAWKWDGKYVCYNRKLGREKLPGDCILIQTDGAKVSTVRDRGKGRRSVYVAK